MATKPTNHLTSYATGGQCLEDQGSDEFRWPGYLGRNYKAGGVLFIGNIHQRFGSNKVNPSVSRRLVQATHALRADPGIADRYLEETRAAYFEGLAGSPKWNVAKPFDAILAAIGQDWSDVAYTNASKSQMVPTSDLAMVDPTNNIAGCLRRFPVSALAADLEARLLVTCSASARNHLTAAGTTPVYFKQKYRTLQELQQAAKDSARWMSVA